MIDFWAPWCGPCRQMEPAFEELAAANPSHKWVKVNVDENPATAARFQILAIPAFVVVEGGAGDEAHRRRQAEGPLRRRARARRPRLIAQLVDVTYAPGSAPLLAGVTLAIHERTKLGVVGPNGSGKTTLLRLLAGELRARQRRGRAQAGPRARARRAGRSRAARARPERRRRALPLAGRAASSSAWPASSRRRRTSRGGCASWSAPTTTRWPRSRPPHEPDRALIADLLGELGLRSIPESRRMSELSGGQRRLVLLARALASDPDLLVLDEPEAHLDLRARGLVAERLGARRGATVLVSHDRALLDVATKETLDLSDGRCDLYVGRLQLLPRGAAQADGAAAGRVRARSRRGQAPGAGLLPVPRVGAPELQVRVARPRAPDAARARPQPRRAAPRSAAIARSRSRSPRMRAAASWPRRRRPRSRYSETVRVGPVDLVLERGDRVALIGPNGAGKSTLLRLLAGAAGADGRPRAHQGRRAVSLMTQESLSVDLERTPLDVVLDERAMGRDDAVRRICALGLDLRALPRPARPPLRRPARARAPAARLAAAPRPAAARRADELHRHALGRGRPESSSRRSPAA